jgi:hypothetical protein
MSRKYRISDLLLDLVVMVFCGMVAGVVTGHIFELFGVKAWIGLIVGAIASTLFCILVRIRVHKNIHSIRKFWWDCFS